MSLKPLRNGPTAGLVRKQHLVEALKSIDFKQRSYEDTISQLFYFKQSVYQTKLKPNFLKHEILYLAPFFLTVVCCKYL